jgi:hypothetical protein
MFNSINREFGAAFSDNNTPISSPSAIEQLV